MIYTRRASCIGLTLLGLMSISGDWLHAQTTVLAPALVPHLDRIEVLVVDGRVTVLARTAGGTITTTTHRDGVEERLRLSLHPVAPALEYEQISGEQHLSIIASDGQRVTIHRQSHDDAEVPEMRLSQAPGEPLRWSLGTPPEEETIEAPSLWHLLIREPERTASELVPYLELLRPNWQLSAAAVDLETELLTLARRFPDPRRGTWLRLVAQLGSSSFSQRERADRALRQAGPLVLGFLQAIPPAELDAEQRYRIRRIVAALSQDHGEDAPGLVARRLITDRSVWLALLRRSELSKRRIAAHHLEQLLGRRLDFDPAAASDVREQQLQALGLD